MKIIACTQGTPEWFEARAGIPTASNFKQIIKPSTGEASKSRGPYICQLIAERISGVPVDVEAYTSRPMQEGIDVEPFARECYKLLYDREVRQAGFCIEDGGRYGFSPDGLVDDDGGLELKCPQTKTHIGYLLGKREVPEDYKPQVHGALVVSGRKWWDFMSYCTGLDPFVVRVEPDDYTDNLRKALTVFSAELKVAWERIQEFLPTPVEVPPDIF